jgi:hypothetical protein
MAEFARRIVADLNFIGRIPDGKGSKPEGFGPPVRDREGTVKPLAQPFAPN